MELYALLFFIAVVTVVSIDRTKNGMPRGH